MHVRTQKHAKLVRTPLLVLEPSDQMDVELIEANTLVRLEASFRW